MAEDKKRQSNIELLRIISMLMIIGLHYLDKGGVLPEVTTDFNANGYLAWALEAFFMPSVNAFFLIAGYFSLNRTVSLKKIFKFWTQVFMYSFGFGIIACVIAKKAFDIYVIFQYVFPIVTDHYWFATVYIVLLVLTPLISAGVNSLDKKPLIIIISLLLVYGSLAKTFIPMQLATDNKGYDAIWMLAVFLTGMYIKKYGIPNLNKNVYLIMYLAGSMVTYISLLVLKYLYMTKGMLENFINYGYSYNYLFCYIASIGLFVTALLTKDFTGKKADTINKIAAATFGVYLFHEHMDIRYLWPKAFGCENIVNKSTPEFILHMILTIMVIFIIGTGVEILRQKILKPRENINFLLVVFIVFFALRSCFKGIDLMDAGYSLGNYKYFDVMNPIWKLATYLSNIVGLLLMKLPAGQFWIGMNFYTSLLLGIVSAAVYLHLTKEYVHRKNIIFISIIMALSLCWAPTTILYHYLGYYIISIVVMLLTAGIIKDKAYYFVISGILLGLAVFVRMPNITYVMLIFPVIYGLVIYKRNKIWLRVIQSVGGFLASAIPLYIIIAVKYGINSYPDMINSLFGMTEKATDYKPTSMITDMVGVYIEFLPWLAIFAGVTVLGALFFKFIKIKNKRLFEFFYAAGVLILFRFFYGRGYFGLNYNQYFAVVKPFVSYITIVIALCIYYLVSKKQDNLNRLYAAFVLVIILICPLGGNNNLYTVMNNMIFVFPVSIIMLLEFVKGRKNEAITISTYAFIALLFIQTFLFGTSFTFHDLTKTSDVQVESSINGETVTSFLITSEDRNEALNGLGTYLEEASLLDKKVLLYGNIPGISYIFNMEPAIFTTWPDLDSNTIDRLEKDLNNLEETPVIIAADQWNDGSDKAMMIKKYMEEKDYYCSYFNDQFLVYIPR